MRDVIVFLLVLILTSIGHLATDIYLPSMPYLVEHFDTSISVIQLTFTAYLLSYCIAPIIVGPISDRIGRKKPILFGIGISLIATSCCIFANSALMLIAGRFLQGIGMGMIACTGRAILPDHFKGQKLAKYLSYLSMGMSLMLAIAPPLGGFIQDHYSWRIVFVAIVAYLFFILFLVKFQMKDSFKEDNKADSSLENLRRIDLKHYLNEYQAILSNKQFMLYTCCTVLTVTGIMVYLTASPFLYQGLIGLSATEYGLTALGVCSMVFISGFVNSRLINIFKSRTLLIINGILIGITGCLYLIFNEYKMINLYTLLGPAMLFFATMPLSFSNAGTLSVAGLANQKSYGAAMALSSNLQFMGGVVGSAFISFSTEGTLLPLGVSYVLIAVGYLILLKLAAEPVIEPVAIKE